MPMMTDDRCNMEKLIKKIFTSHNMQEYLLTEKLWYSSPAEMVFYARIPIDEKENLLEELIEQSRWSLEQELHETGQNYLDVIRRAKKELKEDGIFLTSAVEYRENLHSESQYQLGIFASYEKLRSSMTKNLQELGIKPEDCYFHIAEKYVKDEDDQYSCTFIYYFWNEELYFVEPGDWTSDYGFFEGQNLNMPVPFQAGDIVEIDNRPFTKNYRVIILGRGDNRDCCCVTGMYKGYDGIWKAGALKHSMLKYYNEDVRQLSPLYSATLYDGPFENEDEKLFPRIQEYIRKNFPKGDTREQDSFEIFDHVIADILNPAGEKAER